MTSTNTYEKPSNGESMTIKRKRLLVIHNPTAGWRRRHRLYAVLEALGRDGCAITLQETTGRGDAETFARAARAEDYERVVVAGGDGTINEAINGLTDRRLALAIRSE